MSARCQDCAGTGLDVEHRHDRMIREPDHIYCPLHGDIGWDFKHGWCLACKGSGKVAAVAGGSVHTDDRQEKP